jgi:uncharacterized glyoxalase superfamily protein PhnB
MWVAVAGGGTVAQVTSVFLYVDDMVRSIDFYHEIVGAEVVQVHAEYEGGPIALAILRLGGFSIMLHPKEPHADAFRERVEARGKPFPDLAGEAAEPDAPALSSYQNLPVGLGIHLQLRVDNVDAFYRHCLDEGALLSVSGEPVDQEWGWREFALKDPDGYVWSVYQDNSGGRWI